MLFNDRSEQGQERAPGVPLLPLRDLVVFPHMVVPLIVGRPGSKACLRAAEAGDQQVFLVTQRQPGIADPGPAELFEVGCLARLIQLVALPDGNLKVLVEGLERARVGGRIQAGDHVRVELERVEAPEPDPEHETEALLRTVKEAFEQYVKLNKSVPPEMMLSVASMEEPARMADALVAHLDFKLEARQGLLEEPDPIKRLNQVLAFLQGENDIQIGRAHV